MRIIGELGKEYGLSFNFDKLEVLCARCDAKIIKQDGTTVDQKDPLKYLGATLASDGRIDSEVSRRIGLAHADFRSLSRVWSHSGLSLREKVRIFEACVISRLTYGLMTAWLPAATRRRLDGFQARCLRRIVKTPAAYVSRVSNIAVLQKSGCIRLSLRIREQQLLLVGQYLSSPAHCPTRVMLERWMADEPYQGGRGRGRPRMTWCADVVEEAIALAGSRRQLMQAVLDRARWRATVQKHCRGMSERVGA